MRGKGRKADLLAERLELPAEALGSLLVTAVGRRRVLIENHRGIAQYSDACLCLKAAGGALRICGSGIRILVLGKKSLAIEGDIASMEWE